MRLAFSRFFLLVILQVQLLDGRSLKMLMNRLEKKVGAAAAATAAAATAGAAAATAGAAAGALM
jgi:ribosomal protein L12E/L44/L45/RPP1/RPP2